MKNPQVVVANNSSFFFAVSGIRRASRGKHGKVLPMQQMKLLKLRCGKRYSGEDVFFFLGGGGVRGVGEFFYGFKLSEKLGEMFATIG